MEVEAAVLRLMRLGITRSEAACHIMTVGLEVHTRIIESIESTFPQAESRGDCTRKRKYKTHF